jgi:hypothetical protein
MISSQRWTLLRLAIAGLALCAKPAWAQDPEAASLDDALRVYLDCQRCDFDFIREEVPVVDYVRDPAAADLHVLVTNQRTGAGGQEFTFQFLGREAFADRADTLRYVSLQSDSPDEVRRGYANTFGAGLVRYLAYASQTERLNLGFRTPEGSRAQGGPQDDPWNLWVFRTNMSGRFEGESLERARQFDGSLSASRTTADFKIDMNLRGEYEWEEYDFEQDDGSTTSRDASTTEIDGSATAVWSISPHWSWGLSADAGTDSRANQDLYVRGGPALEFSLYPYAEATSRQITALYRVGAATFEYADTTVLGELAETRAQHSLQVSADFRQPWGEWVLSVEGSHFLDDLDQHRIDVFSNLEIRLFRGFNLDIRGSFARVKDQIYLPIADIDDIDRLTGRVELGTDYEYSVRVGFSFTFGSVFNNVVNPRIRTGGGGRRFF